MGCCCAEPHKGIYCHTIEQGEYLYIFPTMCHCHMICRTASTSVLGSNLLLKKKNYSRDKATANFLRVHSSPEGGLVFSSRLIFDILAAQTTRISGPSNHMTLFACFKQFGTKFTMEMSTLAGEKSSAWLIPALLFIMWYDNLP